MLDVAQLVGLLGTSCVWISTMGKTPNSRVALRRTGYSMAVLALFLALI